MERALESPWAPARDRAARASAGDLLERAAELGIVVRRRRGALLIDAPEGEPADAVAGELHEREAEVAAAIAERPGTAGPRIGAAAGPGAGPFDLTDLQSAYRVGELDFFELRTPAFVAHGYEVARLDVDRLAAAVRALMERHEMLRAAVEPDGRQAVRPLDPGWAPTVVEWGGLDRGEARRRFAEQRATAGSFLPPLSTGPQIAAVVFRAATTTFVLVCSRLFVLDAHSIGLLYRDLAAAYDRTAPAGGPQDAGLFADYVAALAEHRETQAHRNSVAYWQRRLAAIPPGPAPPEATSRALVRSASFERVTHTLDAGDWAAFRRRAGAAEVSPSTAVCCVYAEALRRFSARRRFSLTVLVSTRAMLLSERDPGACIGNFGTTLLLEHDPTGASFVERTRGLQRQLLADLPHTLVSGVEVLRRMRAAGIDAVENVPFVFASGLDDFGQGELPQRVEADGWKLEFKTMQTPQVLLDHQVSEDRGALVCNFDHVAAAFPSGLIDELAGYHADLLRALARTDAAWHTERPPELRPQQLAARARANRTERRIEERGVFDSFERHCRERPDATAFAARGASLSYAASRARVVALGAELARGRRESPELVGVLAAKSVDQYVGALAVVQSGGAYVPLGVDWPRRRVEHLIAEAGVGRVLVDRAGEELLGSAELGAELLPLDELVATPAPAGAALRTPDQSELAYVIFTSGSTGEPKGVAIPHRGLLNTVVDVADRFGFGPEDRILSVSELTFDLSAFDLFGGLHCGATVVVPPYLRRPDPQTWIDCLRDHRVTVWNSVPALMEMVLDFAGDSAPAAIGGLRLVMLSGDWVPLDLPDRIRAANPAAEVVALGGATEASIWSNYHRVREVDPAWKSIPYGRPLANQRYHVLNADLADAPTWVPGELFIAGDGLADGYHRRPDLTATRFVRHPASGERLYRTGDHGRYWPDGTLEFLGRVDAQTKLRGYRIDLLEIEKHLEASPAVRSAACVMTGEGPRQILVGLIVPSPGAEPDFDHLRGALAEVLPAYAIPGAFRAIEEIPLTPNGKRDARALAELARDLGGTRGRGARPPRTELEGRLAELWARVCDAEVASIDARFLALGGSSLLAVKLMHEIEAELGARLPLSTLLEHDTVAAQAKLIARGVEPQSVVIPIRPDGDDVAVLFHPVGGHAFGYRALVDALPDGLAVAAVQSPAQDALPDRLEELGALYAGELEAAFGGERRLHLVGWSMGGVLALEAARALERDGRAPASLTLIDSFVAAPAAASELSPEQAALGFVRDYLQDAEAELPAAAGGPRRAALAALAAAGRLRPGDATDMLEEQLARYAALSRLLLRHQPRTELPGVRTRVFSAARQDGRAFFGLVPIHRHPSWPQDAPEVEELDADHYSIVDGAAAERLAGAVAAGTGAAERVRA